LDTFSNKNIERIKLFAQQIRLKHKAMEWGVPADYLIKKEGLDYAEYNLSDNSFLSRVKKTYKKIAKVIKAAILIPEKVVLIDYDLHHAKKPFGQSHELGHNTIPEHKDILMVCSEHDLSPQTRDEMEFEANMFASEILFPSPLMDSIYKNYPVAMETILQVAELSGASIHSAAIRYVKNCNQECCLLLLKVDTDGEGNKGLRLKDQIPSPAWWSKHKKLLADKQFFPPDHNLSLVVFSGKLENIVKNTLKVEELRFQVHTFYNTYMVFALLF
jgi:Zn-dependent peptidase ImmA (M78 family)